MLLMVEKGIKCGIRHVIHQYATSNDKYIKDYNQNKKLYLLYWDSNNQCGWATYQKLLVDNF